MSADDGTLSGDTFDRLIARAVELDEPARAGLDPVMARQIAQEAGIHPRAWDAAVEERAQHQRAAVEARDRDAQVTLARTEPVAAPRARLVRTALGGLAGGAVWGAIGLEGLNIDPLIGGGMIAASVAHVVWRTWRNDGAAAQAENAAWWAAIPLGVMLGMQEVLNDPIWFAGLSWAGSAAAGHLAGVIARRRQPPRNPTDLPVRTTR